MIKTRPARRPSPPGAVMERKRPTYCCGGDGLDSDGSNYNNGNGGVGGYSCSDGGSGIVLVWKQWGLWS